MMKTTAIVLGVLMCAILIAGQDYGRGMGGGMGHGGRRGGRIPRINPIIEPFPGGYCPGGTTGSGNCQYDYQCGQYYMCYLAASGGFGSYGTCCPRQQRIIRGGRGGRRGGGWSNPGGY